MKKAIQFNDVLGNTIQLKTAIDAFKQVENKPCWIVESRKIFPQITKWDVLHSLEKQYFETDEEAQRAIEKYLLKYEENAQKIGKNFHFEEVAL